MIRTIKLQVIISSRSFFFLSFFFFFPSIPRTSERDFALAMLFSLYSYSIILERAKSAGVAFDRFDGKIERRLDERACEFRTSRPLRWNSNSTWNSSLDGSSPSKRLFHSDFLECRELHKLSASSRAFLITTRSFFRNEKKKKQNDIFLFLNNPKSFPLGVIGNTFYDEIDLSTMKDLFLNQ